MLSFAAVLRLSLNSLEEKNFVQEKKNACEGDYLVTQVHGNLSRVIVVVEIN